MSMVFKVNITVDNAAFGDEEHEQERNIETARILRGIAQRLEEGGVDFFYYETTLFDINGNDVGRAAFRPAD